jgi:hypothetical protein
VRIRVNISQYLEYFVTIFIQYIYLLCGGGRGYRGEGGRGTEEGGEACGRARWRGRGQLSNFC